MLQQLWKEVRSNFDLRLLNSLRFAYLFWMWGVGGWRLPLHACEATGQPSKVSSLLLPRGSQRPNIGPVSQQRLSLLSHLNSYHSCELMHPLNGASESSEIVLLRPLGLGTISLCGVPCLVPQCWVPWTCHVATLNGASFICSVLS